eukprot:scaffold5146_cov134-Skeletonema_marinoi.AAC.14
MKITLPLSFLLCLPAMTMATDSAPDADAVLRRAVDTEAGQSKLSKFTSGKTNRRLAKTGKGEKETRRLAKTGKGEKETRRLAKTGKGEKETRRILAKAL